MLYIINCACCGLQITEQAPKGFATESSFLGVCRSLYECTTAWTSVDTDFGGFAALLCDGAALDALDISDSEQTAIEILYSAVQLELMGRGLPSHQDIATKVRKQ